MKFYGLVAAVIAMMATSVVAQAECRARCEQFYKDCRAADGTETFCGALRGKLQFLNLVFSTIS